MRNRFDRQLGTLHNELHLMGSQIEQAIELAVAALSEQDLEKAKQAIAFDKHIDEQEKKIENLCFQILLSQQPVAGDLRTISAALKMVTDMERIGDQASDIGEIAQFLSKSELPIHLGHITDMARETTVMVFGALEAFGEKDLKKAAQIIAMDDKVDELFLTVKDEVIRLVQQDSRASNQAMDMLMIAKYFERIGDHATNIAEWVIYSITGELPV